MPYKVRKSGGGYKVYGPSGAKSKKPLSKAKAGAQARALYANEGDAVYSGGKLMGQRNVKKKGKKKGKKKSKRSKAVSYGVP